MSKNAKFKVGDKVKIIDASGGGVLGEIKTIKSVHDETEFNCGWFYGFTEGAGLYEQRLELESRKNLKREGYINLLESIRYILRILSFHHSCTCKRTYISTNESITVWIPSVYWKEVKEKVKTTRYVHWFWKSKENTFYIDTTADPHPDFIHNKKENYIKTDKIECEAEVR